MKKNLFRIIAAMLVCVMLLPTFAACKKDKEPDDTSSDTTDVEDTPGTEIVDGVEIPEGHILLAANGKAYYRIVLASNAGSIEKNAANLMAEAFKLVTGAEFSIVNDSENKDDNGYINEILIGNTNREASKTLKASVKQGQYGIAVMEDKIAIVGSTYDILSYAVTVFLRNYVGYIEYDGSYTEKSVLTMPDNVNLIKNLEVSKTAALYVTNDSVTYADALAAKLEESMDAVKRYNIDSNPEKVFDASRNGIVIVAGADVVGNNAVEPMKLYMNAGGRVLFLGGPTFETVKYKVGDQWLTKDKAIEASLATLAAGDKMVLFDTSASRTWSTGANSAPADYALTSQQLKPTMAQADCGFAGSSAQTTMSIPELQQYASAATNFNAKKGSNAFGIWLKALDNNTGNIMIELTGAGKTWYVVPIISTEWTYCYFTAEDVKSDDASAGTIDFSKITKMTFKYTVNRDTTNHTEHAHSIAIHEPAFYKTAFDFRDISFDLDNFYPAYTQYPITNAAHMITEDDQKFISERNYAIPTDLISCHPGTQGIAFDKGHDIRFVPLIRVTDSKNLFSGYAAWINVIASKGTANGSMEGTLVGCFSANSADFYNADGIAAVCETVEVMTKDNFLVDGGVNQNTYLTAKDSKMTAGATFVDLSGSNSSNVTVEVTLYQGDSLLKSFTSANTAVKSGANNTATISVEYEIANFKPDRAVVTMSDGEKVIDVIEQDIRYWTAKPASERKYVYMEDGVYKRDGQIINFFGTTFVSVLDSGDDWNSRWYSKGKYDPEVLEYELDRLVDLEMNAIVLSYTKSIQKNNNNVVDIISLAEERGIYVELAFSQLYPMERADDKDGINYTEALARELIQTMRFHENDNVISFEVGWERRVGQYEDTLAASFYRKEWDDEWGAWIIEQYGSIANAMTAWGNPEIGKITVGSLQGVPLINDNIIENTTGAYTKIVEAYYRFVDDQVVKEFMPEMNYMRSLAPNHTFSFRMSMSGSGYKSVIQGPWSPKYFCFDFQSVAPVVDCMMPEGYKLGTREEQLIQISMANAYARYAKPDAPIVWREFGFNVWEGGRDDNNFNQSEAHIKAATEHYAGIFEYALAAHTSAMYCWWYTPGYRVNENTDCGIINPDGSDRGELTQLFREYAERFKAQSTLDTNNVVYIAVERANQDGGMFGIYEATKEQVKAAATQGKAVIFYDVSQGNDGTNDNAANVWNTTLEGTTVASGTPAPLRYVNGAFKNIKITTEGSQKYANVTVCNTKQSTWGANTVSVVSTTSSAIAVNYTITEQVDYLEDITLKIPISGTGKLDLRFAINGHMFGSSTPITVG